MAAQQRRYMRTLARMHPAVCFVYLLAVIGLTAFAGDPVVVLESLLGAVLLAAVSGTAKGTAAFAGIALAAALANFLFVHNGETAMFFVGNTAFTLEALVYGLFVGVMLAAVCVWGACAVKYVTSDKYIWLFGRVVPAAGLILSCAIRFLPMFVRRTKEFAAVQDNSGLSGSGTVRGYLRAFSASVGYSAEQAMDSALSMKARGYGTARRTSFSLYRVTLRTILAMLAVGVLGVPCLVLILTGAGTFYFYPALSALPSDPADIALYCGFGALCVMPAAVVVWENVRFIAKETLIKQSSAHSNERTHAPESGTLRFNHRFPNTR